MSIGLLIVSTWSGPRHEETHLEHPSWPEVEAAIRGLNGTTHNDVYLCPEPTASEAYLCVGGGNGRYIVTGATKGGRFPTLTDATRTPEPREMLVVGGQAGDYPGHYVVPLETALRAARIYFETGAFSADASWVEA